MVLQSPKSLKRQIEEYKKQGIHVNAKTPIPVGHHSEIVNIETTKDGSPGRLIIQKKTSLNLQSKPIEHANPNMNLNQQVHTHSPGLRVRSIKSNSSFSVNNFDSKKRRKEKLW